MQKPLLLAIVAGLIVSIILANIYRKEGKVPAVVTATSASSQPVVLVPVASAEPVASAAPVASVPVVVPSVPIEGLAGDWVGKSSDQITVKIQEKKSGSVTPWNIEIIGRKVLGCGFYPTTHEGGWRVAYCRGPSLSTEKSSPMKLLLEAHSTTKMHLRIDDLDVELTKN
jgi:hypothetical protein